MLKRFLLAVLCLAFVLPVPGAPDDEFEYIPMKFEEGTPLTAVLDTVRRVMEESPKFNQGGRVKGFVYPDEFKDKKLNFSPNLQIPVKKGATIDQKADVLLGFLHTLLEMSEFALVDRATVFEIVKGDKRIKKPVRIFTQAEAQSIPAEDLLVSQLYTFRNFDPVKLQGVLVPFLNEQAGEKVNPIVDTNTVVLTAFASKMRELQKILDLVDRRSANMTVTFVPLKYAAASEIEPTLREILKAREQTGGRPALPGAQTGQAQILANPRTNKELILLATEEETKEIIELVAKFDTELSFGKATVQFFKIKHRKASEIKDLIDNLYKERQTVAQSQQRPGLPPGPGAPPSLPPATMPDDLRTALIPPQIVADSGSIGATGTTSTAPGTTSSGGTSGGTNTLIVIAPSERVLADVKEIIDQLDRRKPLVLIEAVVMELGPDASRSMGVELAAGDEAKQGRTRGAGATNMGLSTPDLSTSPPTRTPSTASGGLTAYIFKDSAKRIPFLIQLQETDSLTDVLACPKILANDNEKGDFQISRMEPYQKRETTTGGTTTTSQDFAEAKTSLTFTPSISTEYAPVLDKDGKPVLDEKGLPKLEERRYVRLELSQKIESFKGSAAFSGGTPPKESRTATTVVTILDGDTVAIGGFTNKNKRSTINKVPLLGDLPILGWLFRSESTSDSMTTLFIFITPRIVNDLTELERLPDSFHSPAELEELKQKYKEHFPQMPGMRKDEPKKPAPSR